MWHSHLNDMEIPEKKKKSFIPKGFELGGFHVTSSPSCWWTVHKISLISSLCLSTSICSFHHCYLCLPRLHENHLKEKKASVAFRIWWLSNNTEEKRNANTRTPIYGKKYIIYIILYMAKNILFLTGSPLAAHACSHSTVSKRKITDYSQSKP